MQSEKQIYELIRNAGKAILEIYNDQALFEQVETKADASPLTLADKKSHEIIDEGLKRLFP
ncbi:MAG: 3'(2'),5'-bisphosphate nucleotidase CysQ, partial [Cyclobacteriaceae bacterium]|nr:3'(2'),5'-bisphosphate nucleotidase CysQ [Cyclobacteriaceae bacterium]